MKTRKLLWLLSIITLVVFGNTLAINSYQDKVDDEIKPNLFQIGTFYLEINVSSTAFSPATFTVKESATVNVTIESIDIGHTFVIEEYDIEETISANSSINIAFEADQIGTFTYYSVNSTGTGTMVVEDPYVEGMPRPEDINVLLDIKHNSNSTGISLDYFTLLNWTQSQGFNLQVNDAGDLSGTLSGIDVLIILEPDLEFEPQEITAINSFIRSGGSMLIGGSQATADNNINEATRDFGFEFLNSTARYINSTNLIDPVGENNTLPLFNITSFNAHPIITENQLVPLTDAIVDELTYAGAIINHNNSWITDYLQENDLQSAGIQFDTYDLVSGNETIFADRNDDTVVGENETIGQENVLVSITETSENDGRIVALGSARIFNNTFFGRYSSNQLFFERTLQWLAKMYGTIQNDNYELSDFKARKGENIRASLEIYTVNKSTIGFANITLQVMRNSLVEDQFNVTNINQTHFECEIQTAKIIRGTVSVNVVTHKRGYGFNTTKSYFIQIFPRPPEKLPVPVLYVITFVLSIGVGAAAIAFFTIRVLKGSPLPSTTEIEDTEADDEEEIDLDEYEVESTDKGGND